MELLDIINQADEVVGTASIDEIYADKLLHRIVHVLIMSDTGDMALQLRSKQKSFCPGHWSTAVGGHVQAGESYEEAAIREFREELGASSPLTHLGKVEFASESGMKKFITVFSAVFNGPFTPNPEEVERVAFFSQAEITSMIERNEPFHPELLMLLKSPLAPWSKFATVGA